MFGTDGPSFCQAFTLVELVVVLAIISLLIAVSLPNVTRMLEDTRRADAENRLQGLLRSVRMRALRDKETGLFFWVEGDIQKIAFIEAEPLNLIPPPGQTTAPDWGADGQLDTPANGGTDDVAEQDTADRFRVLQDTVYELPPPFRAVPRNVPFETDENGSYVWVDAELANEDYRVRPPGSSGVENHRNFFTIIYSSDGVLEVGRSALIHDQPPDDAGTRGAITGLTVAFADKYQEAPGGDSLDVSDNRPLPGMIVNDSDVALNFPSVDGVLIYDDSVYRDQLDQGASPDAPTKRRFLALQSRPLYISRQTGAIVRGPVGLDAGIN